tara:strand:+ start:2975 stop:4021 length:1047 start_codon:yes stop_codon:yes gene_type:complete
MRIMISSDGPHAHYYIRLGWAKVFQAIGHQVVIWDISTKSAYDAFDEVEPDIFMGQTYNLDRSLFNCIKERPEMKVVMRASDWGDMQNEIDTDRYPILVANKEESIWVERLKRECDKPDFVHNHYHDKWMKATHNRWEMIGVKVVSMMHGADVFDYAGSGVIDNLKSDVTFIGGYWPYKAERLDPYMIRLCNPVGKFNIKIFGGSSWPVVQYCGHISNENVKHAFRSSLVCPNVSEPHSQDFGYDIIERPFKILMSGGFCISDYVESMANDVFTNEELVFAKTPEEFEKLVSYYVNNPEERLPYIQRGYESVLRNHTYFHRIADLFNELQMPEQAEKCLEALEKMIEE